MVIHLFYSARRVTLREINQNIDDSIIIEINDFVDEIVPLSALKKEAERTVPH